MSQDPPEIRWPHRLRELVLDLRAASTTPARDAIRGEIWAILNLALRRYVTHHRSQILRLSPEEIEDLASEKSLEIFRNLESGQWTLSGRSGGEVAAFLSAAARHGLIDLLRRPEFRRRARGTVTDPATGPEEGRIAPDNPETQRERSEFARALRQCADRLQPRARRIWFFRIFYGLASKEIAAHPAVDLRPSHIDVLLQRVRESIRVCMEQKGLRLRELPPGTLAEIWLTVRGPRTLEGVGTDGQSVDSAV